MLRFCCYAALLLFGLGLGVTSTLGITNVGWWKNMPFYQIYPRSFMDSNGDGIGDLNGITAKLEHFVDAGIGAIWLSPIFASPMKDFGYDISDFKAIQPEYGTMDDFEALTRRAKSLGLRVILDLVPNHVSDKHEWFEKSVKKIEPYKDYFIWRKGDPKTPPNNWISWFGNSAWTYHQDRKEWYFRQFLTEQPDLNYNNPAVQVAMADVIWFWLSKGVDGFRIDSVPYLVEIADLRDEPRSNMSGALPDEYTYLEHIYTKDQPETYALVKRWRELLDVYAEYDRSHERVMMTEAYTDLNKTVEFYDAGAHVPFNFKFITDVNSTSPPSDFKKLIDAWMVESDKRNATANWVMGNHDRVRTETRYPDRGDQMTMLAMILPGVSVTYYGEEIGMVDKDDITWEETQDPQGCLAGKDRYKQKSRDPCRTPFQWNNRTNSGFSLSPTTWIPVNKNYPTLNLEAEKAAKLSHYKLYQSLTRIKKTSLAVAKGTLKTFVTNNDQVLTIVRTHSVNNVANETVLLVINFNLAENLIVDLKNQIPSNINFNATIEIASLNSPLQQGAKVDLTKLSLAPKASVVIVANKKTTANNSPNDNGAERDSPLGSYYSALLSKLPYGTVEMTKFIETIDKIDQNQKSQ